MARRIPLLPQKNQPCTGVGGDIQDFTGGESNRSFVEDVVNNFVDTKNYGIDNFADNTFGTDLANTPYVPNPGLGTAAGAATGGRVAATWGGVTPVQALGAAWATYRSTVSIPGLIGFRTVPQLLFTTGVTWATSALLIKGAYNAEVLTGR